MVATLIALAVASQADPTLVVAVPTREIVAQIDITDMLKQINSMKGTLYSGTHNICKGGPMSLQINSLDLSPHGWIFETDGRNGVSLGLKARAHFYFNGNQFLCGYNGDVVCETQFDLIGGLATARPLRGLCRSTSLGALSFGFALFEPPKLISDGIPIKLDPCDQVSRERVCVRWADFDGKKYSISNKDSRAIKFGTRLTSQPIASREYGEVLQPSTRVFLGATVRAGARTELVKSFADAREAVEYLAPSTNKGFIFGFDLHALSDLVATDGRVTDKGPIGQALPFYVEGRKSVSGSDSIHYSFFLDDVQLAKAHYRGESIYVAQLEVRDAKIRYFTPSHGEQKIPFLGQIKARVLFRTLSVDSDGSLSLDVVGTDIYTRVLGIKMSFGGTLLNSRIKQFFAGIRLGGIEKAVDIAFPHCIAVDSSPHDLKKCNENGVLRHVGGYRGVRMTVNIDPAISIDSNDVVLMTGSVTSKYLGVLDE